MLFMSNLNGEPAHRADLIRIKSEKSCRYKIFHSGALRRSAANLRRIPSPKSPSRFRLGCLSAEALRHVGKSEKSCRYKIFHSGALCRETAQSSADPIGETRSGLSPRAAALSSGMVGRVKVRGVEFPGLSTAGNAENCPPGEPDSYNYDYYFNFSISSAAVMS